MLLSANMALKPSNSKNDVELDTSRDAQRGISRLDINGLPNVRADEVISANLNLFAGVQAGIKISGSLQWAPPKDLVTARSVQPSNELDPSKKDWLAVASLGANLSAAAGVGAKGDFSLSLQNGQIILRLKAALIAGVGADGDFSFALGYKALVHFLDIFNRELIKNEYHKLDWIMPEAFEYFTKAQVLVVAGMELQWLFLLGYNKLNSLYDAMTAGDRAGVMAYTIDQNRDNEELQDWFTMLTPEGLGSLLNTLLYKPKAFEIKRYEESSEQDRLNKPKVMILTEAEAHLLQQRSIELILRSIVLRAKSGAFSKYGCHNTIELAKEYFYEATLRFAGYDQSQKTHLFNVDRLDQFMAVNVMSEKRANVEMRQSYKDQRCVLGPPMGNECHFVDLLDMFDERKI